ncbi:GH3 auxin-responsive promoter family protein [Bacteroidota bacterium]
MPIVKAIISWMIKKRIHQMDLFKRYPMEVQSEVLTNLLKTAKNTEWGKKYHFNSINSISDFRERFPIQDYESLKSYIHRARMGEKNVLWPGEIKWFAKSSGTTSDKSKFIPVSKDALEECHFKGGKDSLALYSLNYPDTRILKGKGLLIGGSHQIANFNNESFFGDISAVIIQNLPFWVHFIRTPDVSITLMDDWEEKIELMARATIKDNVTNISGVPSWTLVLFKKILEITGKNNICEVWPDLELFIHGGVSFIPYREQFKKFIPKTNMHYQETYNASEGFFAVQDDPNSEGMLLMLDYGIFYEFIPASKVNEENPESYTLEEITLGENYAIVISTNGGLWRYMIGDTVQFTSKNPFKIRITGRTRQYINTFGEELIVDNAEEAIKSASLKTGALIREYSVAPIFIETNKQGSHQWLVEFEKEPDDINLFTELLDNALKSLNSDYEAKRYKDLNLVMPELVKIRYGCFYEWLKEHGKLGGQHKVPRLSNSREFVDQILEMNRRK